MAELAGVLRDADLVADYLDPFTDIIRATTPVEKTAVLWCVENLVPLSMMPLPNVQAYSYEQFVAAPPATFADVIERLGLEATGKTRGEMERLVSNASAGSSAGHAAWHAGLGELEGQRVLEICRRFGIRIYGPSQEPRCRPEDALDRSAIGVQ